MIKSLRIKFNRSTQSGWGRIGRLAVVAAVLAPQPPTVYGLAALEGSAHHGVPTMAVGDNANLKSISYEGNSVRVELDRPAQYRVFALNQPPRLVIELPRTLHGPKPYEAAVNDGTLKRIRSSQFKTTPDMVTRVVLDLPRMIPYKAVQEGNGVVLRFNEAAGEGETEVSTGDVREGEAAADVVATAAARSGSRGSARPKDLLASLPKNPITIDFDDADIRDVIRVLAEMSGVNIIYSNDLRGVVTIHLDRVPFDEVFNTVLTTQGLVAQQIGNNILRVLTPEALSSDRARSVTTYKTFTLSYGKASEVATHLSAVKISPTGRFTVDERNNAIVVTDTPEGLAAAERLILDLDRKPQQVLIETKIIEINLDKALQLGIQWEYGRRELKTNGMQVMGQRFAESGNTVPDGKVGFPAFDSSGNEIVVYGANPTERGTGVNLPGDTDSTAITFGFINNSDLLSATLNALEKENQTKTLTNPKIVTTNNQQAKIQIGQKVPFLQTTVSGTGTATQSTVFADVGFIIDVTPTISVDNRIRLKVKPEASSVRGITSAGPTIDTTTAETEVMLTDGETIVIGGLVSESMIEDAKKVPLLGDLPVLGVFFRSTLNQKVRKELLVFITARIVPD
ncbi:MAG: type IV pilus secretin PilQ [Elusimicrobia bacterium]|jgi:type IV pilus secretin PilQ/predicted competence protein|nr:type IV pilus secretin PilQ [Elusimicrobiota bacterium]MBK7544971.1 type IV pilus secretin PilQ [Elusimicrobiota bacterium]MBK7574487.1 type IV pilus secretin PilQ [Elusimicrobiota bacterium]MBK7688148.1 type IV pilus secretin PilQ [Elusimicrobiota bacterium]MBK8126631.1 type IV pilus secretin PilQ [Elusimicrobiota bacterium]